MIFKISLAGTDAANRIPKYQTPESACFDIHAYCPDGDIVLAPGEKKAIPTGMKYILESGYYLDIRPRSGLAIKNGITIINTPGTGDADYRNEVKILLWNTSEMHFVVSNGMRIAQAKIDKVEQATIEIVEEAVIDADVTKRKGGFGSSGIF